MQGGPEDGESMPWTLRRMAGLIGVSGGGLSLPSQLRPGWVDATGQDLTPLLDPLADGRVALNGWGPVPGFGDLLLGLALVGLVMALLYGPRPRRREEG